jgi:hypothetical protein
MSAVAVSVPHARIEQTLHEVAHHFRLPARQPARDRWRDPSGGPMSYDPNRLTRDIMVIGALAMGAMVLLLLLLSVTAQRLV